MLDLCLAPDWLIQGAGWFVDKVLPGGILAFFVAWIIPRSIERYKGARDQFYKIVDALKDEVLAYQRVAAAYWLGDRSRGKAHERRVEMEFRVTQINLLMRLAAEMSAPTLFENQSSPGVLAVANLMETTIEDRVRTKSEPRPDKVAAVNDAASRLIELILTTRWKRLRAR